MKITNVHYSSTSTNSRCPKNALVALILLFTRRYMDNLQCTCCSPTFPAGTWTSAWVSPCLSPWSPWSTAPCQASAGRLLFSSYLGDQDLALEFVGLFSSASSSFLFLKYRWDLLDFAFVLVFYSVLLSHLKPISINLQSGDHSWLLALVPLLKNI